MPGTDTNPYVMDHQFKLHHTYEGRRFCDCGREDAWHAVIPNEDGGVTLHVEAYFHDEPEDHETGLKVGDWVTVPGNSQGTVWQAGHVEHIYRAPNAPTWRNDNGWRIVLGYAARESSLPPDYRAHATRQFITTDEVGEIWRQRRVVVEEAGAPTSTLVWYRVRPQPK